MKKEIPSYRAPRGRFEVIEIPERQYLAIDGQGSPGSDAFASAISSLYPVAYALKFASKKERERDYVVPPLEGLWWADDMSTFTTARNKSRWQWTLLLLVPGWLTREDVDAARSVASSKGHDVSGVRVESLDEGRCVQTLHVGSFDDEGPVLQRMHDDFIPANNLVMTGRHHEIYLSDFRRVEPEKLRTILRQPVTARS
ncbi:GyrI-like domain-containing protein [Microbacterium sp. C7(2022)]|nr:GyrI-like domain-containing protein [Microbacterium sp. C7(2022)]